MIQGATIYWNGLAPGGWVNASSNARLPAAAEMAKSGAGS